MRISAVMAVYDGGRFLEGQLASLAAQSRPPDELVVGDDGSIDGSDALVERFADSVGFPVRLHRNPENLRATGNFARLIGLCEGDVIVTADQDDAWFPGKLARIEAEFARSPEVGLVFSDAELIDGEGRPIGNRLWPSVRFSPSAARSIERGDAFATLLRRPVITGATMAFRTDLREIFLPIPRSWTHDHWIGLMVAAASRIRPIAEPLMQYRKHAENQVGVLGASAVERLGTSLARPRARLLEEAARFVELREALASRLPGRADLLTRVDGKVTHALARGSLPDARASRIPVILRELATGRYSRYSGGPLAGVRDLIAAP